MSYMKKYETGKEFGFWKIPGPKGNSAGNPWIFSENSYKKETFL